MRRRTFIIQGKKNRPSPSRLGLGRDRTESPGLGTGPGGLVRVPLLTKGGLLKPPKTLKCSFFCHSTLWRVKETTSKLCFKHQTSSNPSIFEDQAYQRIQPLFTSKRVFLFLNFEVCFLDSTCIYGLEKMLR